jgi:polyhydroxyalkanoate synthesis regulator phasin
MAKLRSRGRAWVALMGAAAAVVMLAVACGGGSTGADATPTVRPLPTLAEDAGTPVGPGGALGPGAGAFGGPRLFFGGASEELAAFLGISLDQLESELSAEGATPGSVAEAHGRTRDELKSFFTEQAEANANDAVAAGTMSQEDADNLLEDLTSRIDDIIDGQGPFVGAGGPGPGLFIGGPSEEFAAFLSISLDQLESELSEEGATPGSVAEAHGRTRDELKSFFTEQAEASVSDAVAAGTMSQEDADSLLDDLSSRIDAIIDGNARFGPPGQPPAGS